MAAAYARIIEEKIPHHRLIACMGAAHRKSRSRALATARLNQLDRELGQYMRYAEKKCQKIRSGRIPFSPKAPLWICCTQVYQSFLRFHAGRIRNQGNLKQAARRCNTLDAMSLLIKEIYLRLKACVEQSDHFRKHGKYYGQKHLYHCLETTNEKEDEEAERLILAIIQQEKDRNKPRGGWCFNIQIEQVDGMVEEINGKEDP